MDIQKVKEAADAEEARSFAILWQEWQEGENLSYGEHAEWGIVWTYLGAKYGLTEEFEENGIL